MWRNREFLVKCGMETTYTHAVEVQGVVTHRGATQTNPTWEATHSCLSLEEVKRRKMGNL